ncbi:PREDICTED: zinc finger protein 598 [Nicrophorus vespilloides]|uniref:RING-type E3 ubiquitin transferase n=1 Tax=Nicrophorus vespilloides TaxID=110193 RepID=A0ABM1NDX8_NICVS|nr:PREDICTED: zinc finger protein 598 [Nicrophorus vespilloides]XP_017785028.1 PREDICTED: zinc finger protein 598 [Nicrophorus vespilloides]
MSREATAVMNNSADSESTCVVCFKSVEIYSIGQCEHPVCYECSTRMRVLCKQNECPICRADLPKVIFTKQIDLFENLRSKTERTNLQDVKYGMYFCSPSIQTAYYRLLEFACHICLPHERKWPFKTFNQLKDHMRREHELFYCDICVDNLKIFSFERRTYTRSELAQHRRKGDSDNKSHRGHPLCEFCDQRYLDGDELFRHLRRDHLYCHFCDADGKHQYYPTYDDLKNHFLDEHYLCEEGDCKNEQFTSVFRTDIDYKAHVASAHSKHLSRAANKQARTLEVEFNFGPRRNDQNGPRQSNNNHHRHIDNSDGAASYENFGTEPGGSNHQVFVNPLRDANFPTLGGTEGSASSARANVKFSSKFSGNFSRDDFPTLGGGPLPRNLTISNQKMKKSEDFPTLGGAKNNITITKTSTASSSSSMSLRGVSSPQIKKNKHNFPSLCEREGPSSTLKLTLNQQQPQSGRSNLSIHVNHKSNGAVTTKISTVPTTTVHVRPKSVEDFPALSQNSSSSSSNSSVKQWVQPKPKKEPKPKAAPAPVLPPSSLAEFPSLSKKSDTKKTSSVTMPMKNWSETSNDKQSKNSENKQKSAKDNKGKKKVTETATATPPTNNNIATTSGNKSKKKKGKNGESSANQSALNLENEIKRVEPKQTIPINEVVKKTSTLKIGNLVQKQQVPQNQAPKAADFPALGKPPPGINVKPPPGFNIKSTNDLTFTNSSGQSYSILPGHSYSHPHNFSSRNCNLIQNFFTNKDIMMEFKNYSYMFRNGNYSADKYYNHCKEVLGDGFSKVFPEMLVLLPDIEKQQELFKVHKRNSNVDDLEECATCKQIIFHQELKQHLSNHYMEYHYPVLGQTTNDTANAWKK